MTRRIGFNDSMYEVDAHFMGPKGLTLWPARHRTWLVGGFMSAVVFMLARHAGVGVGVVSVAYMATAVVLLTRGVTKLITYDMGVRHLAVAFWHEVSAPRKGKGAHCRFRPPPTRRVRPVRDCRRCRTMAAAFDGFLHGDPVDHDIAGRVRHRTARGGRMCEPGWAP